MDLTMTTVAKDALVRLLSSCGGTTGAMQNIAERVYRSESSDLGEILGGLVVAPGPIREIIETCQSTNGVLDLEGLIRHFASFEHTTKMTGLRLTVARELPATQIPLAHTLLPLSILGGKYYYDCGKAHVELMGLVQIGPAKGSPYAHLAGLIWLPDEGLGSQILEEQRTSGVSAAARGIDRISYFDAPKLRAGTISGASALYGKS